MILGSKERADISETERWRRGNRHFDGAVEVNKEASGLLRNSMFAIDRY